MTRTCTRRPFVLPALVALLVTIPAAPVAAQGITWSIAAGPTIVAGSHDYAWSQGGQPVSGATQGRGHAALAARWMVPGWSLGLRGELLVNRLASPANSYCGELLAQCARSDETVAASVVAEFRARRGRVWTPYLLVGLGAYHGRIGVSEDATREEVVDTYTATSLGGNVGAGLEMPIGPVAAFVEARHHQAYRQKRGAAFVPISFGLRF